MKGIFRIFILGNSGKKYMVVSYFLRGAYTTISMIVSGLSRYNDNDGCVNHSDKKGKDFPFIPNPIIKYF